VIFLDIPTQILEPTFGRKIFRHNIFQNPVRTSEESA
jgi:hypothetical protein